ncbi:myc-associated zinc finger protein [Taeniopygia guttata]|uniref:myc-associated zinc finger protein n=1 Tax=Taeniopygia guttata TaxID=59729 RepID=UPI003BB98091
MTSSMTSPRKKGAPHVCGLCAKEFKNGYNLRRHQATHGDTNTATATTPKRGHHPRPSPTPPIPHPNPMEGGENKESAPKRKSHACDTCGKAFRDVYHLKRHRLSHTDERPFQCPVCQQRFKRKDRMAAHVRSHQGHVHKPYACGHCGKSFSRPDHLNSHVRQVHSTERPFKCQRCEAAFATRDRLRAHSARHQEKSPCPVCGKLLSPAHLGEHLRGHGHAPRTGSGCPSPSPGPAPAPPPPLDGAPGGSQGW